MMFRSCDANRRLGAICASLAFGAAAFAQTASDITPSDFAPEITPIRGTLVFEAGGGLTAPPGSEALTIRIAGVTIDGARPEMAAAAADLRRRLTSGRIVVSEIFAAASDYEAAYAEAGFVLARVAIPEQGLVDGGTLRIVVVDGFIEDVATEAVAEPVRERIDAIVTPLEKRPGVRIDEIERRLLIAGDTFGVALGSALSAGASPGGTVLVLDSEYRPITGFVTVDNLSSDPLGRWSFETGLELNGRLGFGEVIYGRFQAGLEGDGIGSDPRQRTIVLGGVLPVNSDGLLVNLEVADTVTNPDDEAVDTTSSFSRQSLRVSYPWIRSLDTNLTIQAALDFQHDELDILTGSGPLNVYNDKTRVLRFSGDYFSFLPSNAALELGGTLSFGLDALGADSEFASFTKLEVSGRYRRQLGEKFALAVAGRGQTSFGSELVEAEKLGVATAQEVSTFPEGSITGDNGWLIRTDVSYPIETEIASLPARISPYVFAAHAEVTSEDGGSRVNADAYGIGVELIQIRDPEFSSGTLRIELGEGTRDDGGSEGTRLSVIGSLRF